MCSVSDCDRPVSSRGLCKRHYERLRTTGTTDLRQRPDVVERFNASYVVDEAGCWIWQGQISHNGYGRLITEWVNGGKKSKRMQAHRWVALTMCGGVPDGWHVDHLCKVRACVNPFHLEVVSAAENNARSDSPSANNLRQTHCVRGHDFADPSVLYVTPDGRRQCRPCRTEAVRRHQRSPMPEPMAE